MACGIHFILAVVTSPTSRAQRAPLRCLIALTAAILHACARTSVLRLKDWRHKASMRYKRERRNGRRKVEALRVRLSGVVQSSIAMSCSVFGISARFSRCCKQKKAGSCL